MPRRHLIGAAALALVLGACGPEPDPHGGSTSGAEGEGWRDIAPGTAEPAGNGAAPPAAPASAAPDEAGPVGKEPVPDGSPEAAAQLVQRYFALLEAGRYHQAWRLWDGGGAASGMTPRAFADSFDGYAAYRGEVGVPGRIDAGAGQRYIEVPVRVHGTLRDGRPLEMEGSVILHRAGDVPGATPEQRSWRIYRTSIKPQPDEPPAESGLAPGQPAEVTARYRCADGSSVVADFDNEADTVTLTRDGERLGVLQGQRPASGIWYSGEGMELRGKGRDATLSLPGRQPLACRAED